MKLTWTDTEEDLDEIGSVEGAKDWSSVVERAQVRPTLDLRRDPLSSVEHDSAGQGESKITKNGGQSLKLWVPVVQQASSEW